MKKLWRGGLIASVPFVLAMGAVVVSSTPRNAWAQSASASANAKAGTASASASANLDASESAHIEASARILSTDGLGGVYGTR
jgi:hypothetical protein